MESLAENDTVLDGLIKAVGAMFGSVFVGVPKIAAGDLRKNESSLRRTRYDRKDNQAGLGLRHERALSMVCL